MRFRPLISSVRAFTLIELLVVVAIMALVAGGVIVVYDQVQQRAELSVARRQLSSVREALLRFRVDMGYFPGEGPLAPESLNLEGFFYVDGTSPNTEAPPLIARQRWSAHPMNLWMLYEKPLALDGPGRWDWNPSVARGWQGPYLGHGTGARLDAAGEPLSGFLTGALSNRLYGVTDLIGRASTDEAQALRWVSENLPVTNPGEPEKTIMPIGGRPIAFLRDTVSTPPWAIYRLVSAGANGIFDTVTVPAGDDISVEVSRHKL